MTKRWTNRIVCLLVAVCASMAAWGAIPDRPDPPRLVNDFAGVLGDVSALEDSLRHLSNTTGNQIVVVTVASLDDLEPWDYATQLGRKWGVGQKGTNNGVVMLIKPKTSGSAGQAFIAPGYGLEGALPDALCTMVVKREMIPHFKNDDYNAGVWAAVKVVSPIAAGEYPAEKYLEKNKYSDEDGEEVMIVLYIILLLVIAIIVIGYFLPDKYINYSSGHGSGTWGGGRSSWGGGGSSWGGGGSHSGGFGGFGGGSFGGGGGGASW